MICSDKSYNVATLLHLICVFNIVVRLLRQSIDDFAFDTEFSLSRHYVDCRDIVF